MPPWWKIRRELVRPLKQLMWLPKRIYSLVLQPWIYDTFYSNQVKIHFSNQFTGDTINVCIFVVFPKSRLEKSHYHTINHLNRKGFHSLVISNGNLDSREIEDLSKLNITLIIRPNIGYDFGGYREGILFLESLNWLEYGKNLILLNDSCWFPVQQARCWIEDAFGLKEDFIGVTSNFGVTRSKENFGLQNRWKFSTKDKNFHYASFCLFIKYSIFQKKHFQNFWKKYPLTNDKRATVRRGEIGLTQLIIRNNHSHTHTQSIDNLPSLLRNRTNEEIYEIVKNMLIMEQPALSQIKKEINNKIEELKYKEGNPNRLEELRKKCINFILLCCTRQGSIYTLVFFDIKYNKSQFIKKSPLNYGEDPTHSIIATANQLPEKYKNILMEEIENYRAVALSVRS